MKIAFDGIPENVAKQFVEKFVSEIVRKAVTRAERRCLRRAGRILAKSDIHEEFFLRECVTVEDAAKMKAIIANLESGGQV